MKIKFLVIILFVIQFQISCMERNIREIIDGGNYRYWRFNSTESWDDLYYFDNEGNWTIFEGYRKAPFIQYTDFKEYNGEDNLLCNEWAFVNDSTIIFNGYKRNVSILNDTILILKFIDKNDSVYKNSDTIYAVSRKRIPPEFRKKHKFRKYKTIYI